MAVATWRGRMIQEHTSGDVFTNLARQIEEGVIPADTVLTERPPWVAAWDDLSPDEQRMHARGQEVFAGFLTHTDAQIGRFLDFLDQIGESENTVVVLLSDHGEQFHEHGGYFHNHSLYDEELRVRAGGGVDELHDVPQYDGRDDPARRPRDGRHFV